MMKITLILEGYLKNKYSSSIIELNYPKPVTIFQVLKDAKINLGDVWLIKVGDSIVKKDYLLERSNEVKLFQIVAGG
jgi:sulfur carrier protein ThiS